MAYPNFCSECGTILSESSQSIIKCDCCGKENQSIPFFLAKVTGSEFSNSYYVGRSNNNNHLLDQLSISASYQTRLEYPDSYACRLQRPKPEDST